MLMKRNVNNDVTKDAPVSHCKLFLYTNKLYKNTRAEIGPKIKNKLRTITRLKICSEKIKNFF